MPADYQAMMIDCAKAAGVKGQDFALPAEHDVILNGIRLRWLDWGNRHLPHVVLLHGGSLTAHTWDMAVLCLRDKYHLIALDQRGHGDSEWTAQKYLHEDSGDLMLEDTRQFIEYLDFDRLALVGMSMGGMNAIRYASRYPERLDALAVVDVAPVSMSEGQREMRDFSEATQELFDFEDFLDSAKRFMPHRPEAHLRYSLTHSLKETPGGNYTWKRDRRPRPSLDLGEEELQQITAERIMARWDDVRNIALPVILFRGSNSKILSPEVAGQMIDALPNGRLVVIADATHNVHSDNPVIFASELDSFLMDVLQLN